MLRKIRITLAILSIIGVSLLFLDFTGTIQRCLGLFAMHQLFRIGDGRAVRGTDCLMAEADTEDRDLAA